MSESLRELIKIGIDAYKNGLEMEKETIRSIDNSSKNVRISYDNDKTGIQHFM